MCVCVPHGVPCVAHVCAMCAEYVPSERCMCPRRFMLNLHALYVCSVCVFLCALVLCYLCGLRVCVLCVSNQCSACVLSVPYVWCMCVLCVCVCFSVCVHVLGVFYVRHMCVLFILY